MLQVSTVLNRTEGQPKIKPALLERGACIFIWKLLWLGLN